MSETKQKKIRWRQIAWALMLIVGLLALAALILPTGPRRVPELGRRIRCQDHLHNLDVAIVRYQESHSNTYPTRLSELVGGGVVAHDFVCPGSHSPTGSLTNVDQWTDYIYVADKRGLHEPGTPVLLCIPENHLDKGLNLLDSDHSTGWFSMQSVEHYYADTNLAFVVSDALTIRSKGRYKSRP